MSIREIRGAMGFSQQELAGYLNLNRTQMALFEKGHRALPWKAAGKWSRIEQFMEHAEELEGMMAAIKEEQQPQVAKLLSAQLRRYNQAACSLRLKLEKMEDTYRHSVKVLAFVAKVRKLPTGNKGQEVWLNRLEGRMLKRCWTCGPGMQALVAVKLKAIGIMMEEMTNNYRIF